MHYIMNAQLPKDNMKKGHQKALKELRSLEDEVQQTRGMRWW